jgi:hypothetical protein
MLLQHSRSRNKPQAKYEMFSYTRQMIRSDIRGENLDPTFRANAICGLHSPYLESFADFKSKHYEFRTTRVSAQNEVRSHYGSRGRLSCGLPVWIVRGISVQGHSGIAGKVSVLCDLLTKYSHTLEIAH